MGFSGMCFFEDTSSKLNPFIEKMEKGELTLEDILNDETVIQDIKVNSESKFINFFTKDKIQKLIDYSTKMPSKDEHNIGYKFPFYATEILCCDNTSFQNKLMAETNLNNSMAEKINNLKKGHFLDILFNVLNSMKNGINIKISDKKEENKEDDNDNEYESDEDEKNDEEKEGKKNEENNNEKTNNKKIIYENIDYLLQFLKESDKTKENYVLVGYFYKILNSLLLTHQMKIVDYLLDYPRKDEFDVIDLMVKHMNRKSMCNIIQKLLTFDHELICKYDDKKLDLLSKVFDELDISDNKDKNESICDCICIVMNNRQFFDLFMTKKELLEKIYKILSNCKNNDNKFNCILKILIKINDNIIQHFPVHYTDNNNENNNDLMQFNYDQEKSISSPDETELLKKYLFTLFDILEKDELKIFENFGNFDNSNENGEFVATYMDKQKKIGMTKILQTEYLKTLVDILVNSYASKYNENKIEQLIKIASKKNIFWNLHDLFINFPFSNIFQIYYNQIMKFVLNENSPDCIIEAFFNEENNKKRNIIDFYIDKILLDPKFNFKLTNTPSFNPLLSFIITIIGKIYTSQNLYIKSYIEKNKNISVFYEIIGQETENLFNQKLLLSDNNLGAFDFSDAEDVTLQTFGPKNFLEVFEENCKIYEMYKKGEDYKKALNDKKERIKKEKEKEKEKEKKDNKMEKRGLEYIEDFEEDNSDPLFKVEKLNDLKKEKDNFLAYLNKPTEDVNVEEENTDVIVDNIGKDGENKTEQIGRCKELWEDDDEEKEKEKAKKDEKDNNNNEQKVDNNKEEAKLKENNENQDNKTQENKTQENKEQDNKTPEKKDQENKAQDNNSQENNAQENKDQEKKDN